MKLLIISTAVCKTTDRGLAHRRSRAGLPIKIGTLPMVVMVFGLRHTPPITMLCTQNIKVGTWHAITKRQASQKTSSPILKKAIQNCGSIGTPPSYKVPINLIEFTQVRNFCLCQKTEEIHGKRFPLTLPAMTQNVSVRVSPVVCPSTTLPQKTILQFTMSQSHLKMKNWCGPVPMMAICR